MDNPDIMSVSSIYDALAQDYERHVTEHVHNAYCDRPAVLSLLPPVQDKRVLDIGCGPGWYATWLIEHGAQVVVGLDISAQMIEQARQTLGDKATFYQHDLSQPLTFVADASFDLAVAPLMLHYVTERVVALREVARVLTNDGSLVVSTLHPFDVWRRHGGSYFTTELVHDTWNRSSRAIQMPYWRVPLTTLCNEFTQAGFFIDHLLEPQPEPTAAQIDPVTYRELMEHPAFITFRLCKRVGA